jgi:hypothetical protein
MYVGQDTPPAARKIDELIWAAFTDADYRARLLNGQRGEIVAALDLTEAERQVILSAEADSLESLAGKLSKAVAWSGI